MKMDELRLSPGQRSVNKSRVTVLSTSHVGINNRVNIVLTNTQLYNQEMICLYFIHGELERRYITGGRGLVSKY